MQAGGKADVMKAKKRESGRRSATEMALIPLNKADENSGLESQTLPTIPPKFDLTDIGDTRLLL